MPESNSIDDFLKNPAKPTPENIIKAWKECGAKYVPRPLTREESRRFAEVRANEIAAQEMKFTLGEPLSELENARYRLRVLEFMREAGFEKEYPKILIN